MLSQEKLLELDRQRVWHPYAPMPPGYPPPVVAEASGVRLRLRLADGAELIDGMSSW
jgi:adenosylmethionine-8-amino-7-oxononanoate aminotransferase